MFPLGTIAGSSLLLVRGGIRRKGRALVAALLGGSVVLAAQSFEPPLPIFLALILVWGLCASVFLNCSRTLYQEAAPPSHRARVLSVYSLGLMGMSPVGMMLSGLVADWIGAAPTCAAAGISMALLVTTIAARTRVVHMR
jgi:MFS family permease